MSNAINNQTIVINDSDFLMFRPSSAAPRSTTPGWGPTWPCKARGCTRMP